LCLEESTSTELREEQYVGYEGYYHNNEKHSGLYGYQALTGQSNEGCVDGVCR